MRRCCWALLLSLVVVLPAIAQEIRGTILGTVRDHGGVVPGATVTITNLDTRGSQQLVTTGSGYFEAPLLHRSRCAPHDGTTSRRHEENLYPVMIPSCLRAVVPS